MFKKKMLAWFTAVLMLVLVIGIFYYASYVQNNNNEVGGTFVKAFGQKSEECCL